MTRILIVDERAAGRALLRKLLGRRDYRIAEAADAAQALRLLSSERPDLVVADSAMAAVDRLAFVRLMDDAQVPLLFTKQPGTAGEEAGNPAHIVEAIEGCLAAGERPVNDAAAAPDPEMHPFAADLTRIGAQLSARPWRAASAAGGAAPKYLECLETLTALARKPGSARRLLAAATLLLSGALEADDSRVIEVSRAGQPLPPAARDAEGLLAASLATCALSSGSPVAVTDLAADPRFAGCRAQEGTGLASALAVKVECRGKVRAIFGFFSRRSQAFGEEQVSLVRAGAGIVALALERIAKRRGRRRARNRLHQLLAAGPAAIYCLHLDGETLTPVIVGENIERLTGYSVAQAMEAEWWRKYAGAEEMLRQAAESLGRGESRLTREYALARADGTSVWVRDEARVLVGKPGAPLEIIGSLADITDWKAGQEELLQARKMESFEQLAGGIAHEYNNLLTVIAGFAWLELSGADLRPPQRRALEAISQAADSAIGVTRRLETFSRPGENEPGNQAPEAVIDNLLGLLRGALGTEINLRTHVAAGLPPVEVDPGAVEHALLSLVLMVRNATPRGGDMEIRIEPVTLGRQAAAPESPRRAGDFLCFEVRAPRGAVPALSAVQALARRHRGWVETQTYAGRESIFRLFLPAARGGRTADGEAAPPAGQPAILLVEDNEPVRSLMEMFLSRWGYRVSTAESVAAAEAILRAPELRIDLMITEVALRRGVSGTQLADRARELRPGLPVLYTGAQPLPRMSGLRDDQDFVRKPFEPDRLAGAIARCLGRG